MSKKVGYTRRKIFLSLGLCVFLIAISGKIPAFAQEPEAAAKLRQDLWVCPGAEISMYSISNAAYEGGLALGYGNKVAIGFKATYLTDVDGQVNTIELNFLLRLYFPGNPSSSGPFIQLGAGPAIFTDYESTTASDKKGTISAGLSAGWRFLLGRYWFLEPVIRAGYPYIAGAGLSAGFHF